MTKRPISQEFRRRSERGNIFFTLFGAVAVVGVLGAGIMATMRGPLSTMVEVNRRTQAEAEMSIASKLVLLEAVESLSNGGDCDSDDFVEPLEYKDPSGGDAPAGGGYLPDAIGSNKEDPWGISYGYCAWDAGPITADTANCDDNSSGTSDRLDGTADASQVYTVIAVVSAGPDQIFQTTCTGGASPAVTKSAGSDDIIASYSYQEAAAATGGLWTIKSGDPGTAEIAKNIEAQGAKFSEAVDLTSSATAQLKLGAASMLYPTQAELATCNPANNLLLRVNTSVSPPTLEICDGNTNTWESAAAGAAGINLWQQNPLDTDEIYYDTDNVGIGLTDPAEALDVTGNVQLSGNAMLSNAQSVVWASGASITEATGALEINANGGAGVELDVDADAISIAADTVITGTTSDNTADALSVRANDATDILVVQNDGMVGIGTADPNDALDVSGDVDVSGNYKIDGMNFLSNKNLTWGLFLGENAGANTTGINNTILGSGAAGTLVEGTGNIVIGQGMDVPAAATSNYLNIGDLVHGDMTNKRIGVGFAATTDVSTFDDALEVSGSVDATGNVTADGDVYGTDIYASSQIFVNGDQLGAPAECSSTEKLEWNNGVGWSCVTDQNDGSGGGGFSDDDWEIDSGNSYVYNTTDKIGIGTATPAAELDVSGTIVGTKLAMGGFTADDPAFFKGSSGTVWLGNATGGGIGGSLRLNTLQASTLNMEGWWVGTQFSNGGLGFGSGHTIEWASTSSTGSVNGDIGLTRDAAGVLRVTDGSTAEGDLKFLRSIFRETTAPSATADYGKLYVKSADSKLYFMDDSGAEYDLLAGGGGGGTGDEIADADDDTKIQVEESADEDKIRFDTAGSERMIIDETGKVGIGMESPSAALDVARNATGSVRLRSGNSSGGTTDNQILLSWNDTNEYTHAIKTRHNSATLTNNAIDFYLWTYGTDSATATGTGHVMTLENGKVGIGTTSPSQELHVQGKSIFEQSGGTILATDADVHIGSQVASPGTAGEIARIALQPYGHTGGLFYLYNRDTASAAYLDFRYGSTPLMTIQHTGSIGVATSTISTGDQTLELDVEGDIGAVNYCDADGYNCFTAAAVASGTDDDWEIDSVNSYVYNTTDKIGIGTSAPLTLLHLGNTSYTFADGGLSFGDGDTGIYESGDDILRISIGGTYLYQIDSGGLYSVSSTIRRAGLIPIGATDTIPNIRPNAAGDTNTGIGSAGADILSLIAGGVNSLNITATGVGVNTSTLSTGDQTLELDVEGDIGAVNYCDADGYNCFQATDVGGGGSGGDEIVDADADTKIQVEESADEDKIRFDTAGTERMIIDETGKVGIGIAPTEQFEVYSSGNTDARIRSDGVDSIVGLRLLNDAQQWRIMNAGSSSDSLIFRDVTGSTDVVTIQKAAPANSLVILGTSGNVGIGRSAPVERLHAANTSESQLLLEHDNSTGTAGIEFKVAADDADQFRKGGIFFQQTGSGGIGSLHLATTSNTSATPNIAVSDAKMTITSAGTVGVGTTAPSTLGEQALEFDVHGDIGADNYCDRDGNDCFTAADIASGTDDDWQIDSGNSYVYNTTDSIGIGTATPANPLHVLTTEGAVNTPLKLETTGADSISGVSIKNDARNWHIRVDGTDSDKFKIYDVGSAAYRMAIDTSGNVGIGTTVPAYNLDLSGNMRVKGPTANGRIFLDTNDGSQSWILQNTQSSGAFILNDATAGTNPFIVAKTAPSNSLQVASTGYVGVGISSPSVYLDVAGTATNGNSLRLRSGDGAASTDSNQVLFSFNNSALYTHALKTRHNSAAGTGNALDFYVWNQGTDGTGDTGTKHAMTLENGNVGIGTTSPSERLHILSADNTATIASVQNTNAAGTSANALVRTQASTAILNMVSHGSGRTLSRYGLTLGGWNEILATGGSGIAMGTIATTPLVFGTNSSERMRIDGSGNVGIGITSPVSKLHVVQSSDTSTGGISVYNSAQNRQLVLWADSSDLHIDGGASATRDIRFQQGGTGQVTFNGGNVGIGVTTANAKLHVAGSIFYTGLITDLSDKRLKTDIEPLGQDDMLERLMKVDTYSFHMKDEPDGPLEYGVIAQELEKIFPELVQTADDEIKTKSVNYIGLIAPVIEVTQALKQENDALKAELAALKTDQAHLAGNVEKLSRQVEVLSAAAGHSVGKASMQNLVLIFMALLAGTIPCILMILKNRKSGD